MSTFSWAQPLTSDQDLTVLARVSLPSPSSPIPSEFLSSGTSGSNWNSPSYLFTEDCVQMLSSWSAGTLNALHPDFSTRNAGYSGPNFFLVAEGPRRDIGGGLVRWTRVYGAVPATHYEPETYSYPFIGWVGDYYLSGSGVGVIVTGRPRLNVTVTSRLKHEYFLVGFTDPTEASTAKQAVADFAASYQIPSVYALRYYSTSASLTTLGAEVDAITDPIAAVGPFNLPGTMSTTPSRSDYNVWMNNAQPASFYKVGTSYALGAVVSYTISGVTSAYVCIAAIASSLDSTAPDNATYWSLYAHSGFDGDVVNSLQWKGNWLGDNTWLPPIQRTANGVSYAFGDQVIYLGKVYTCNHAQGAFANDFPNSSGKWTVIYPSQFVAEDSRVSRWQGNIFVRQTRYILAR